MDAIGDLRLLLAKRWQTTPSGPFFDIADPPTMFLEALPVDFLSAVAEFGGREGFLGDTYLRLYRLQELVALNLAYEVPTLLPEVIAFGSNSVGEAFAFRLRDTAVVQVPFLPLMAEHARHRALSFSGFIQAMAASGKSHPHKADAVGMEVHDKHPICLGGSPTDPANKVLVPVAKHAEICRFWNTVYRDAVARQQGSAKE
jgi:hypothetical protein